MATPASVPVQPLPVLTPEILVQVVRIEQQVRWQRRRGE